MASRFQLIALLVVGMALCRSLAMNIARRGSALQDSRVQPITSDTEIKSAIANQNVLLLLPAAYNSSELEIGDNFSLFKLNTDILMDNQRASEESSEGKEETSGELEAPGLSTHRAARKINFLRGMWNKPKFSPLYLVNGTVCRFINSSPICTTLSTTGLLPLTSTTARPATPAQAQQSGNFVSNNPNNNFQQGNNQNFRPAAIVDDDPQDINVEGASNSTEDSARSQQQGSGGATLPVHNDHRLRPTIVNRRPLNPLLSLRRPARQPAARGRSAINSLIDVTAKEPTS